MKKLLLGAIFLFVFLSKPAHSASRHFDDSGDQVSSSRSPSAALILDIPIKRGSQYCSSSYPLVYLECNWESINAPDQEVLKQFQIKIRDGENKDKKAGFLTVSYYPIKKEVHIVDLEIIKEFRKKGYGESSLRILLGTYRKKLKEFEYFSLTVKKQGSEREAARSLYKKLGFQEFTTSQYQSIGVDPNFQYMYIRLDR